MSLLGSAIEGADSTIASVVLRLIDEFSAPLKAASANAVKANEEIGASSKEAGAAAGGAATLGLAALVGGMAYAVKQADDTAAGFKRLQDQFGLTGRETTAVKQAYEDLGARGSVSLESIRSSFAEAEPFVKRHADAIAEVGAGWKLAQASGQDMKAIVQGLSREMMQAHQPASQLAQDTALIYEAAVRAHAPIADFEAALARIAPLATAANVSFGQQVAALSALTEATGSSQRAGMAFTQLLALLENSSSGTQKKLQELGQTSGVDLVGAFERFRAGQESLSSVLEKVRQATGGHAAALEDLGIKGRTAQGLIALLTTQWDSYEQGLRKAGSAQADLNKGVTDSEATISASVGRLENVFGIFAEKVGDDLRKPLGDFSNWVQNFQENEPKTAASLKDLQGSFDQLGGSISDTAGALGHGGGKGSTTGLFDAMATVLVEYSPLTLAIKLNNAEFDIMHRLVPEVSNDLALLAQGLGIGGPWDFFTGKVGAAATALQHLGGGDAGGFDWTAQQAKTWGQEAQNSGHAAEDASKGVDTLSGSLAKVPGLIQAANTASKDWASTLNSDLGKALEAIAREQTLGLPVSEKQRGTLKALSQESVTYETKLASLRHEYGLDISASDKLNASIDAQGKALGSINEGIDAVGKALATAGENAQVADARLKTLADDLPYLDGSVKSTVKYFNDLADAMHRVNDENTAILQNLLSTGDAGQRPQGGAVAYPNGPPSAQASFMAGVFPFGAPTGNEGASLPASLTDSPGLANLLNLRDLQQNQQGPYAPAAGRTITGPWPGSGSAVQAVVTALSGMGSTPSITAPGFGQQQQTVNQATTTQIEAVAASLRSTGDASSGLRSNLQALVHVQDSYSQSLTRAASLADSLSTDFDRAGKGVQSLYSQDLSQLAESLREGKTASSALMDDLRQTGLEARQFGDDLTQAGRVAAQALYDFAGIESADRKTYQELENRLLGGDPTVTQAMVQQAYNTWYAEQQRQSSEDTSLQQNNPLYQAQQAAAAAAKDNTSALNANTSATQANTAQNAQQTQQIAALKATIADYQARESAARSFMATMASIDPRMNVAAGYYEQFMGSFDPNEFASSPTLPPGS